MDHIWLLKESLKEVVSKEDNPYIKKKIDHFKSRVEIAEDFKKMKTNFDHRVNNNRNTLPELSNQSTILFKMDISPRLLSNNCAKELTAVNKLKKVRSKHSLNREKFEESFNTAKKKD